MAFGLPSGDKSRAAGNNRAARRRARKPVPTAAPGPATHVQQPVSAPQPTQVLGGHASHPGDRVTDQGAVNQNSGGAASIGYGQDRVNKRFVIGYTPDGRIVHLYGNDVPAAQRRVVLRKGQRV